MGWEAMRVDERRKAASFAASMQVASGDLRDLTATLAVTSAGKYMSPSPQAARVVRVDLGRMCQLLDSSRQYVDEIELTSVGF